MDETNKKVQISLIANAGLLIEGGGKKIILDGIYGRTPEGFSEVPADRREALLAGEPPYDGITHVLISHYHVDHYNMQALRSFFENQKPVLVVPDVASRADRLPEAKELWRVPAETDKCYSYELGNGDVLRAFVISHSGKVYRGLPVVCYWLLLAGKEMIFLSDADFNAEYLGKMTDGAEFDAVFANPLFLDIPTGRKALFEKMRADRIFIFHMPSVGDPDPYGMWKMTETNLQIHDLPLEKIQVIGEPGEKVTI